MKLSVVITTHNRPASLARTLESVKKLADEIVVIDSSSEDDTVATAKKYTAHVHTRPNNLMLNVNKNFGFTKATGDWILNLDDDEEIPKALADEIRRKIQTKDSAVNGYWIPRKNIIFGAWIRHGLWWPDRQLRLFKRGSGKFPEKHVHEYIDVAGQTDTLETPFVHYNYESVAQYLEKMQTIYIQSEVNKYKDSGYRVRWADAVRFPVSDFIKIYFAQSGYKDGLHGLVLAVLQAFYSFMIFAKLWELEQFPETEVPFVRVRSELTRAGKEVRYWTETASMKETRNPFLKVWHRLRRRYAR